MVAANQRSTGTSPDGGGWSDRCVDTNGRGTLVTAAFYGWLPLYLPELFPTRVRATITLIYILGAVLIWFAPETKGKPLPE